MSDRLEVVDPLQHPAWDVLIAEHAAGSFFHLAAWARVLQATYGHRPVYLCRFAGDRLEQALPLMEVSSRWTGRRGVCLPFSDFCLPLSRQGSLEALYSHAVEQGRERGWRYLEVRGRDGHWPKASPSVAYYGHVISLRSEAAMFAALDSSMRRAIRKGREAGLDVDYEASTEAIHSFYALHCQTRRRHGLPPQPVRFFENIARHVLEPGHGFVVTARYQGAAVASAVFFHHGRQAIYKFGASDFACQHLRPNNLVMWEGMRRCASFGMETLHLGRTSLAQEGLRRFKLSLGGREEKIDYCRYDFGARGFVQGVDRAEGPMNTLFRRLPPPLLRLAGRLLYPHLS